ncbi:hypothetical protein KPH14_012279 [Odynerus spinipes]|uniref:Uncharacterized protein n=1 Tax=Odynerus spinipes TaxID=1348599 RepID=A0AAD9RGA6_9HYME|nr:hypothetical protein KPH14_012279 [Odynerus spinipes]
MRFVRNTEVTASVFLIQYLSFTEKDRNLFYLPDAHLEHPRWQPAILYCSDCVSEGYCCCFCVLTNLKMLNTVFASTVLTVLFLVFSVPDVASYNKYGRSCKDIGCLSSEVCVMAEDPCTIYTQDKCGRYPTCKKVNAGEASCTSTICHDNEYCRSENGVPKCVSKVAPNGFESAGVDIVNGQRVSSSDTNKHVNTNTNPYANANAPPLPADPISNAGGSHQANFGNNLGHFASPGNPGTSNNNNGYPPYPSTNQGSHPRTDNLGYPPYPTQNRMPQPGQPGQPGHGYGYPPYSGQSGYPQMEYPQQYPNGQRYPVGQYPGYQNYPNQNRVYPYNSNSIYLPYQRPGQRRPYYPRERPTPPPRAYGPGRSSGHSGSRNTIGDNSVWNRLFGGDHDRGHNSRPMGRIDPRQTDNSFYRTHVSTDKNNNRIWTFSG